MVAMATSMVKKIPFVKNYNLDIRLSFHDVLEKIFRTLIFFTNFGGHNWSDTPTH